MESVSEDDDSDDEARSGSETELSDHGEDEVGTGDAQMGPLAIWSKKGKGDDAAWAQHKIDVHAHVHKTCGATKTAGGPPSDHRGTARAASATTDMYVICEGI